MNRDTTPEVEAIQFRFFRGAPAWKKLQLMNSLNQTARTLAMSGIRRRHPEATAEEQRRYLADLILGEALATRVFGTHSKQTPRSDND